MNNHEGMHFVGSYPADSAREAMSAMLTHACGRLRSLPDGETGSRDRWIAGLLDSFRTVPRFRQIRGGSWADYDDRPVFAPVPGNPLRDGDLNLGYVDAASESYAILRELRTAHGYADLPLQAGLPSALALAVFTFCPPEALRASTALLHTGALRHAFAHRDMFRRALAREIRGIWDATGGDVVYQLELPVEVVLLSRMPGPAQRSVARALAASIRHHVTDAPAGARWGLHLCVGDLANQALATLRSFRPLVSLVNEITARWPDEYTLDYVHLPFAAGSDPAPNDPAAYAALAELDLPAGTRLAAGLAHENQHTEIQRNLYNTIIRLTRHLREPPEIMISAACGLGRRRRDAADDVISHMRAAAHHQTTSHT